MPRRDRTTPEPRPLRQDGDSLFSLVSAGATVEVGNREQPDGDFVSTLRASKWGGECFLELTAADVEPDRGRKPEWVGGRITHPCKRHVRGQPRWEHHQFRAGSTEWEIVWASSDDVPDAGHVEFLLDFPDGLSFHKQLALTQEEIDGGAISPNYVVDSYAVYWPQNGRYLDAEGKELVNYATGKFAHIYRPKLIDDDANERWCDQAIILADPWRLRVYLDTDWLASAAFPVTLDPTFGYESAGASAQVRALNYLYAASAATTPASDGTVDSISVWTTYAQDNEIQLGLYADSSGPAALLANGAAPAIIGSGGASPDTLQTATYVSTPSVSAGVQYHFGINHGGGGAANPYVKYDSVVGHTLYYRAFTYAPLPSPFGSASTAANRRESFYATYTATGNVAVSPSALIAVASLVGTPPTVNRTIVLSQ